MTTDRPARVPLTAVSLAALWLAGLVLGLAACMSSANASCGDGQLSAAVAKPQAGSSGANVIQAIAVTNTSGHNCVVDGYTQVVAIGTQVASNGTRLSLPTALTTLVEHGDVATKPDPGAHPVDLPPRTSAFFYVESAATGGTGESPFVITQLDVTVPGTHTALTVPIPYPGLASSAPADQPLDMTITALGPS